MKNLKKYLAFFLVAVMVFSLCACTAKNEEPGNTDDKQSSVSTPADSDDGAVDAADTNELSWLRVGEAPLVDGKDITLKIGVMCDDVTTDPENTWMYKFIEECLGINVELEYFYAATRDESVALMMASGDVPDLMIGMGFSTDEIARYGAQGMFLDMAPYINETDAPNLYRVFTEDLPNLPEQLSDSEGHLYTLGFNSKEAMDYSNYRMYYNWDLIEEIGCDIPETLDEFVDMLRAMKQYGEDNGETIVPLGGNYSRYNPTYLILNALGYNITQYANEYTTAVETLIALRDGEVVMPAYDREAFPAYLETMHTLYTEGLMEQDFYTLDKDTVKAHLTNGMYGVFSEVPGIYGGGEFGQQWWGGIPLTSEYNDTAFWPSSASAGIGGFAISADTEYPELCIAFADFFCADGNRVLTSQGPNVNQTDYLCGFEGWFWDEEINSINYQGYIDNPDAYESLTFYRYANYCMWAPYTFGYYFEDKDSTDENGELHIWMIDIPDGTLEEQAGFRKTTDLYDEQYAAAQVYTWGKYTTDELSPKNCFFDEETTARLSELKTLIDDYATQEIAKFITGARDLSEIDDYFAELESLGADEYIGYYADYYAAQNA